MFYAVTPMLPCRKRSCTSPVIAPMATSLQGDQPSDPHRRLRFSFPKPLLPRGCSLRYLVQIVLAGALDKDFVELDDPCPALEAFYFFFLMFGRPPKSPLFPNAPLFQ